MRNGETKTFKSIEEFEAECGPITYKTLLSDTWIIFTAHGTYKCKRGDFPELIT